MAASRSNWVGYVVAISLAAGAVGIRLPFLDQFPGVAYITIFPAVVAAAWFGGLGPGLIAVITGAFGAWYFLLPPYWSFELPTTADSWSLIVFAAVGCFLSGVVEALRRARDRNAVLAERQRRLAGEKEALLREKELLIREIHHRVKNQLQTAVGLLRLQQRRIGDPAAAAALAEAASRLMTLQQAYERLQISGSGEIDVGDYIGRVVRDTVRGMAGDRIAVDVAAIELALTPERAFPLALIANELVSNAVKHAFGAAGQGRIEVALRAVNGSRFALCVADDGVGLPDGFEFANGSGFGSQIVLALATTLAGSIAVDRDRGARIVVTFDRDGPR